MQCCVCCYCFLKECHFFIAGHREGTELESAVYLGTSSGCGINLKFLIGGLA